MELGEAGGWDGEENGEISSSEIHRGFGAYLGKKNTIHAHGMIQHMCEYLKGNKQLSCTGIGEVDPAPLTQGVSGLIRRVRVAATPF